MIRNGDARFLPVITTVVWFSLAVASPPQLNAQSDMFPCVEPTADVDTIIRRIELVAAGATQLGRETRSGAMYQAVAAPFWNEPCPRLRDDVDRTAAIRQLLQYAADHSNEQIGGPVLRIASQTAYRLQNELNWDPTQFLFQVIENGRTAAVRTAAVYHLTEEALDPQIRGRLVAIARRAVGPPAWPDLPSDLVNELPFMPWEGAQLLLSEIRSAPVLIENPLARWRVECGLYHQPPRPASDPCHPRNAPPRIGS